MGVEFQKEAGVQPSLRVNGKPWGEGRAGLGANKRGGNGGFQARNEVNWSQERQAFEGRVTPV